MADVQNKVKAGIDDAADRAKQATDRVASAVGHGSQCTVNHLKGQAQDVADKARDAASHVAERVNDFAGQARDRVQQFAGDTADRLGVGRDRVEQYATDAYNVAGEQLGDFGKEITTMVRRYPIPALLVGFGVGLLIGRAAKA